MRISTLGIISILIGLFIIGACSPQKKRQGGPIVVQLASEPKSLHPLAGNDANRTLLFSYIGQRLLAVDAQNGAFKPAIAKELPEISDQGRIFTFKLDEEATWPDGKSITPEDVVFSIKAILATDHPQARLRYLLETLEEVSILENQSNDIQFRFSDISVYNLNSFLSIYIIDKRVYDPENILEALSISDLLQNLKSPETFTDKSALLAWNEHIMQERFNLPRGNQKGMSGPYYIASWVPGTHITLVPNANYWGASRQTSEHVQKADSIIFRFVKDPTALRLQLRQEAFDVGLQLPNKIFDDSLKLQEFNINKYNGSAYTYLAFNVRPTADNPLLSNEHFRQAIAHLLPVEEIIEDHYEQRAFRVLSPIIPGHAEHNDTLKAGVFDLNQVGKVLDKAGFLDTDGDLMREKPEGKTPLTFSLLYPAGVPAAEATALRLRESARQVGISIEIQPLAFAALIPRLRNHDFEAVLMANAFSPLPYDFGQDFNQNSPYNFTGFGSAFLDSLIDESGKALNPADRKDIVWQIQAEIHRAKPIVYLFTTTQPLVTHRNLGEVNVTPFSPYVWLNALERRAD